VKVIELGDDYSVIFTHISWVFQSKKESQ